MKHVIKISVLIVIFCYLEIDSGFAQRNSNIGKYNIESECLGIEMDGSVTLRAWGTGQNKSTALEKAKKNAIREILFNGTRKGNADCYSEPLIPEVNAEMKYEDYFNRFFSDKRGEYRHFVSGKDERLDNKIFRKGMGDSRSVTYSIVLRVLRSKLKEQLIEDGILK